jgi:DNA-binding transcriptional ArsR family regulator
MIEKLVTSKTRIKILKLFLSHIDDRYYLRVLERLLDESLSPLRRQLVKLANIGILITEEEANLKYYRLNRNFEGLEELKELVLGKYVIARSSDFIGTMKQSKEIASLSLVARNDDLQAVSTPRQFRYDLAILSFVSVFVLATAMFVVYANNKNINMVSGLVVKNQGAELASVRSASPASNGEMMSKKWKIFPGNIPVLSSGEAGEDKKSKEL